MRSDFTTNPRYQRKIENKNNNTKKSTKRSTTQRFLTDLGRQIERYLFGKTISDADVNALE